MPMSDKVVLNLTREEYFILLMAVQEKKLRLQDAIKKVPETEETMLKMVTKLEGMIVDIIWASEGK